MNLIPLFSSMSVPACASVGASLLTSLILFRTFFDDFGDFLECLRLSFQPDIISVFTGEWNDAHWASVKLGIWILPSVIIGFLAYPQFLKWFPDTFP